LVILSRGNAKAVFGLYASMERFRASCGMAFSESIIKQIHKLVLMDRPEDRGI